MASKDGRVSWIHCMSAMSPISGVAPSRQMPAPAASLRTSAVTFCSLSTSLRRTAAPAWPVAPVRKTFIFVLLARTDSGARSLGRSRGDAYNGRVRVHALRFLDGGGRVTSVGPPVLQYDLDRGRSGDGQQRAEDAEQRGAEQYRDDRHDRVDPQGPAIHERLHDVVLD